MPSFLINDRSTDPQDDLVACAEGIRLAGWWRRAGIGDEHWPLTTEEVVRMLREAGEFDVEWQDIHGLIERRLLAAPAIGTGGVADHFEWSPYDVIQLGGMLEARQQWKATPSGHDAKKHPCRVILEQARAEGNIRQIADGNGTVPRFDVRHLLVMIGACDQREGRAKQLALLAAVLEADHGIII